MKCNMMNYIINTDVVGGLVKVGILLCTTSSCLMSPVAKTQQTTASTTTVFLASSSWSFNDTTAGNVTCTGNECSSSSKFDLALMLFLRVLLIVSCVFAFVALVKLSDVLNRRCTCKKKRNVYFTKL